MLSPAALDGAILVRELCETLPGSPVGCQVAHQNIAFWFGMADGSFLGFGAGSYSRTRSTVAKV